MPSPFEQAMAEADNQIQSVMMSAVQINGQDYPACFDEVPREMDGGTYGSHLALSGSYRTATLFKTAGYQPKRGDTLVYREKSYCVTGFGYQDGLLILQVE